jgi:two-component system nitrate/nitrite response regulator NarP
MRPESALNTLRELKLRAIAASRAATDLTVCDRSAEADIRNAPTVGALEAYFDLAEELVIQQSCQFEAYLNAIFNFDRASGESRRSVSAIPGFEQLSKAEQRIYVELAKGKPNKILAYEQRLSEATIKAHVSNILRKLNVRSRGHAIALFVGRA